ncbi:transmembrane protein 116 [Thalassophryne amazonica]|uniref:transmembrane protein 116 n=1 Tax=Thalassophryne amazonica TaxID=390379 RepID=UPI0014708D0A|nr:transmembrane protein 116 [Thalassophryne amazonica]
MLDRLDQTSDNSSETNTTGPHDWTQVYEAVRWIQLIMALLSILGSGSIIVCVTSHRRSWTTELQRLFLLSVSDMILAICWIVGAMLYSQNCNVHRLCYHVHIVEQILYMASFFYTLNYVWSLYTGIRDQFHRCSAGSAGQFASRMNAVSKLTALLSGLLPVMLMTPVFIQGNISRCQANYSEPYRCLLMHTGALYLTSEHQDPIRACYHLRTYRITVFLLTFIITLTGIVLLMGKARHIYRRVVTSNGYLGDQQRASFRVVDRRMLLYPSVFVFCWGPAVFVAAMRLVVPSAGQGVVGVVLYILQAFTSASQGFLNCLVYGWTNAVFRRASRMVLYRDMNTQTPLLQSQKNRSYKSICGGS